MRNKLFRVESGQPLQSIVQAGLRKLPRRGVSMATFTSPNDELQVVVAGADVHEAGAAMLIVDYESQPHISVEARKNAIVAGITQFGGGLCNLIRAIEPHEALQTRRDTDAVVYTLYVQSGALCADCGELHNYDSPYVQWGIEGRQVTEREMGVYSGMLFSLGVPFSRIEGQMQILDPIPALDAAFYGASFSWAAEHDMLARFKSEAIQDGSGIEFLDSRLQLEGAPVPVLHTIIDVHADNELGDYRGYPLQQHEYASVESYLQKYFHGIPPGLWSACVSRINSRKSASAGGQPLSDAANGRYAPTMPLVTQ